MTEEELKALINNIDAEESERREALRREDEEKILSENERRKRVNTLKRGILGTVVAVIAVLTIVSVTLGIRLGIVSKQLNEANARLEELGKQSISAPDIMSESDINSEAEPEVESYSSIFDQEALLSQDESIPETEPYYIYLTFDDGPSTNTDDILTILREYGVKATFFVNGKTDEESLRLYGDIVQAGHTLGMHSYSHRYGQVYASREAFAADYEQIKQLLTETTGKEPLYYRFPGGSSNTTTSAGAMREYMDYLHSVGTEYIDWNIDSGDGDGASVTADAIVDNVFRNFGKQHINVVLLHDGSGHEATVAALPRIIERARNMGAQLLPVTEETVPVQHRK